MCECVSSLALIQLADTEGMSFRGHEMERLSLQTDSWMFYLKAHRERSVAIFREVKVQPEARCLE